MKWLLLFLAALLAAVGPGCGSRKKEITSLQRKEAATLVSEADFAVTLRDYARAEGLLVKATDLCPDTGEYWLALGTTRMRLGQRDGAKTAYKRALSAYEDSAQENKTDPSPVIQQVTALVLLGRADDARGVVEKLSTRFPDNRTVRLFVESKPVDRALADPKFKEVSL
jgi:Flp pilus assembly protein TadD